MAMTEKALQTAVIDLAKWSGWMVWHDNDSRRNSPGWPDLVLVHTRTGRMVFAELKSEVGRVRPEQHLWLRLLGMRHETYIWRPSDWDSGSIRSAIAKERLAA